MYGEESWNISVPIRRLVVNPESAVRLVDAAALVIEKMARGDIDANMARLEACKWVIEEYKWSMPTKKEE